jgi:heterotetrameric sarcosine oxidase gamma subunit
VNTTLTSIPKALDSVPEFESPIASANRELASDRLVLRDQSATTKLLVRSSGPQFGVNFGTSRQLADALICGTRPHEWLVVGQSAACAAAITNIDRQQFTNVVEMTHGLALLYLAGTGAKDVLSKVCNLDLHDDMFPHAAVAPASIAGVNCDLVRIEDALPGYMVVIERSSANYLFRVLARMVDLERSAVT